MDTIEKYCIANSSPEDELLAELDRATHLRTTHPQMLSGRLQGKLLEMVARMIRPRRTLEIGTFTGYSALCMAAGLEDGATLDTIEADDELEGIARSFFDRSPHGAKIRLHIGSALEVAPRLAREFSASDTQGTYDLIFIDGDKREYPDYLRMALGDAPFANPLVHSGSFILADNILWYGKVAAADSLPSCSAPAADRHTQAIAQFNRMVASDPRLENVIIPLRDGLNLIRVR